MEFLKHHYEKLILAVLLIAFIGMMFYVLGIIKETRKVSDSELQIKERQADYVVSKPENDEKLRPGDYWKKSALRWEKSVARGKNAGTEYFSDLVQIYPMARCPQCNSIIPRNYFSEKKCPTCQFLLKKPPERPKYRLFTKSDDDLDGDGIPNDVEKKYGLDPEKPYDAQSDKDLDGFSNIFEYQNNTDLNNPKSHPPLWMRLRLVSIEKIVLPVKFMVLTAPGADQKLWDIQINTPPRRKGKKTDDTRFYRLGDTITIEKRKYKFVRIERIIEEAKSSSTETVNARSTKNAEAAKRELDRSRLYLEEDMEGKTGEPDKLVMIRGENVYSSDKRPVLEDLGYPEGSTKKYTLRIGEIFPLGTVQTKISRYQVVKMDEEKMLVTLRDMNEKTQKTPAAPILISKSGAIPEEMRIAQEQEENREESDVK